MLRRALPPGVYVQAYEDRIDLLRATVIGPLETPYEDGLYVFDIQFPGEYPSVPPNVQYYAHGMRLNPNLYQNGKVCLSLLNTWQGKCAECWTTESTLLQVLVSTQSLILVKEPYYNEPGLEAERGTSTGLRNSAIYSEGARIMSLQSLLELSRNPPSGVEELLKEHLVLRGKAILKTARLQHESNVTTDNTFDNGDALNGVRKVPFSQGFRTALGRLLPRLETLTMACIVDGLSDPVVGGNEVGE